MDEPGTTRGSFATAAPTRVLRKLSASLSQAAFRARSAACAGGLARYVYRAYNGQVTVEFDPSKNALNLRRHGVSLAEGDGVLNDPLAVTIEDLSAVGEQRLVTVGMNTFGLLMVVVWTEREENIRLISVRRAEAKERRAYEEGI